MSELKPAEEDELPDEYRGSEGWLIVAVGNGKACYLAVDPGFGALRFWIDECGLRDPEDAQLCPDDLDPGVYRTRAKAWTSRSHEGEHDMGFEQLGEWELLWSAP